MMYFLIDNIPYDLWNLTFRILMPEMIINVLLTLEPSAGVKVTWNFKPVSLLFTSMAPELSSTFSPSGKLVNVPGAAERGITIFLLPASFINNIESAYKALLTVCTVCSCAGLSFLHDSCCKVMQITIKKINRL